MISILKTYSILLTFVAIACLSLMSLANTLRGGQGPGGGGNGPGGGGGGTEFDFNEETHLYFMRAEEKLAHDVYLLLGDIYPDYAFTNIVDSETNHEETMVKQLTNFALTDLNAADGDGEFNPSNYGDYFIEKYAELTQTGQQEDLLTALKAGALIEELDMHDIVHCPQVIVDDDNGIGEDECGMDYTDEKSLLSSYDNLLEGSRNHLRAFVRQIESTFPEESPYTAQFLSQDEVDEILGR